MSKIEWTDKTWNPWWGCDKIAPECGLPAPGNPRPEGGGCYAAIFASRGLHSLHWGVAARGEWTGLITRAGTCNMAGPVQVSSRHPVLHLLDVRFLARAGATRVAGRSPRCDRGDAVGHLPSIDEKASNGHAAAGCSQPASAAKCVGRGDGRASEVAAAAEAAAPDRGSQAVPVGRTFARTDGARPRSYRY